MIENSDAMKNTLLRTDNYFEDFEVGDVYRHKRGRTVTETDNVMITLLVMNTAEGHFNEDRMAHSEFKHRITFGGITTSLIIGLASEDTGEHVIRELGLDAIRFHKPVFHGDTLFAYTEVLEKTADESDGYGKIRFRHIGLNQKEEIVFTGERDVLMAKRSTE